MAKRTHKEIIQAKIDKLEEQISKLQEKTVALQDEQDKLQEELKAAEKAEKAAAEKAQIDEIVKAVKKSGKSPEEIMAFLSNN